MLSVLNNSAVIVRFLFSFQTLSVCPAIKSSLLLLTVILFILGRLGGFFMPSFVTLFILLRLVIFMAAAVVTSYIYL